MLFRKKIERSCIYCAHGAKLEDGTIFCAKKGMQPDCVSCFRFRYDPCKRIPVKKKAIDLSLFDKEDFSL